MKNIKNNTKSNTTTAEKDLAQTPAWFIASVCRLMSIREFNIDVCSLEATKKAKVCYSLEERNENCLLLDWKKFNWCNPPFSDVAPFVLKAISEAEKGNTTALIMPNNPETEYVRLAKENSDTYIEMPFRLKFLKLNGEPFIDKNGKEQSPQFSCLLAIFTRIGLKRSSVPMYYDFRV